MGGTSDLFVGDLDLRTNNLLGGIGGFPLGQVFVLITVEVVSCGAIMMTNRTVMEIDLAIKCFDDDWWERKLTEEKPFVLAIANLKEEAFLLAVPAVTIIRAVVTNGHVVTPCGRQGVDGEH